MEPEMQVEASNDVPDALEEQEDEADETKELREVPIFCEKNLIGISYEQVEHAYVVQPIVLS